MMYTISIRTKSDKVIDIVTAYENVTFVCRMLEDNPQVIEYIVSHGGCYDDKGNFAGGKYLEKLVTKFDYTRQ